MEPNPIASKIARLVEERGWNQEDFARIAQLNRHTARTILKPGGNHKLRNNTVAQCATALNLRVNELRDLPLDQLLPRMNFRVHADEQALQLVREQATMPEFKDWLRNHPERLEQLTLAEARELLAMQEPDGEFAKLSVEACVQIVERRRLLLMKVEAISRTYQFEFLEQFVNLLHGRVER